MDKAALATVRTIVAHEDCADGTASAISRYVAAGYAGGSSAIRALARANGSAGRSASSFKRRPSRTFVSNIRSTTSGRAFPTARRS